MASTPEAEHPQMPEIVADRQKWEYKTYDLKEIPYSGSAQYILDQKLEELGEGGWELVGFGVLGIIHGSYITTENKGYGDNRVFGGGGGGNIHSILVFKRPKL